ncbi:MAG: hypothetical protein PHO37_08950, partial [Kiritimatiellae bacterium]|nr:hypothetical protein [Kiritimatiellia bacterium]
HDTRPVDVLDALEAALATATGDAEKIVAAQGAVARYADVDNQYARYVSGRVFGDMIREVALSAAQEAAKPGATRALINSAVRQTSAYNQASVDASNAKVAAYTDTASASALQVVVAAIVDGALAASAAPPVLFEPLAAELEQRGFAAAGTLQQAIVHLDTPSSDYTDFVRSAEFAGALAVAADAAAKAAVAETRLDPFYTESSLKGAARIGAATALHAVYASAARARQTELPLAGVFALGAGDARLSALIGQAEPPLGAAALTGKIILPANHPTNPFRHRRHPDHTSGFNLERCLRFDFDGLSTNVLERSGLGVERITGIYREEVLGLHKPLGPQPATNPIGLKVEGTFELNRISLIDTLNAR